MSSELIIKGAWKHIRAAARSSKRPALAAVAYFGKSGATLLPLRKGSRLVVDASEAAVKSGQTYPNGLLALQKKGVQIFSYENLHAKVVVAGGRAFVGSTNLSRRSENVLLEAVLETTDRGAVKAARRFIRDLCLSPLGPRRLKELQAEYRPPVLFGDSASERKRGNRRKGPGSQRTWLVRLVRCKSSDEEQRILEKAERAARSFRKHRGGWEVDSFRWFGRHPYRPGDRVLMMIKEDDGRTLIDAPGIVLSSYSFGAARGSRAFVHLELPKIRRKELGALARRVGRGAKKRLSKGGSVGSGPFLESLLRAFER